MNLEDAEDRRRSLAVPCRWCNQPAGEVCIRRVDRKPMERVAAHPSRLRDAGVIHAPLDSRELRGQ